MDLPVRAARSMTLADTGTQILLAFALFAALLLVPLFLVPELLLRRGMVEWQTRVVAWVLFGLLTLTIPLVLAGRGPTLEDLARWETWLGVAAVLFAAGWDLRRARRQGRVPGKA